MDFNIKQIILLKFNAKWYDPVVRRLELIRSRQPESIISSQPYDMTRSYVHESVTGT